MAQQIVNLEKLAEAQASADAAVEAADAAMEAATLAAEKVADLAESVDPTSGGQGDGGTAGRQAAAKADDGVIDGYRVIRHGPEDFSVEGVFRQDGVQRFRAANGFPSEAAERQWVYDQQAKDA